MTQTHAAEPERELFESLFGEAKRTAMRTPVRDDDVQLAERLLAAAGDETATPKLVELLCNEAHDLAIRERSGYDVAIAAMRLLARRVPAQASSAMEKATQARRRQFVAARGEEKKQAGLQYIRTLRAATDAHLASDPPDYRSAGAALKQAAIIARLVDSPDQQAIERRAASVAHEQRLAGRIADLRQRIRDGDKPAAEALVKLYVIELDRPEEARKYTFALADEAWKTNIPLASKHPFDVDKPDLLTLGLWYRELATTTAEKVARRNMLTRARIYLGRFLQLHTEKDLDRTKADLSLTSVDGQLESLGIDPATVRAPLPEVDAAAPAAAVADGAIEAIALRAKLEGHHSSVTYVAFTPDGQRLVSIDTDEAIVWDVASERLLARMDLGDKATVATLSPDGSELAVGYDRGRARIFRLDRLVPRMDLKAASSEKFVAMAWDPVSGRLAAAHYNTLTIWDPLAGEVVAKSPQRLAPTDLAPAMSKPGFLLLERERVLHFDPSGVPTQWTTDLGAGSLAVSRDGATAVVHGRSTLSESHVLDLSGRGVKSKVSFERTRVPKAMSIDPGSGAIVLISSGGVEILDPQTAETEVSFSLLGDRPTAGALSGAGDLIVVAQGETLAICDVVRLKPIDVTLTKADAKTDALAKVDIERHSLAGEWRRDGDTLVSGRDTVDVVLLPVDVGGPYTVEVTFTYTGEQGPVFRMPTYDGEHFFEVSPGPESLDLHERTTSSWSRATTPGAKSRLQIEVTKRSGEEGHVRIFARLNGRPAGISSSYLRSMKKIPHPESPGARAFRVTAPRGTRVSVHDVTVTPIR